MNKSEIRKELIKYTNNYEKLQQIIPFNERQKERIYVEKKIIEDKIKILKMLLGGDKK